MAAVLHPGFDTELALANLTNWLVQNVPDVRADMSPFVAASVHGNLHANLESYEDDKQNRIAAPRCDVWPCKAACVSLAIFDIHGYLREARRPGTELMGVLRSAGCEVGAVARRIERLATEEEGILDPWHTGSRHEFADLEGLAAFRRASACGNVSNLNMTGVHT